MPTSEKLFWNAYARIYDVIWNSPLTRAVGEQAVIGYETGCVIDLGCGTGLSSEWFRRQECTVIGVDSSFAMLERAVAAHRVDDAIETDAKNTGLPDACASVVLVVNVLQFHEEPTEILDEAWRLLSPGGRLVVVWPTGQATLASVYEADRRSGRPLLQCVIAQIARLAIGIPGAMRQTRKLSGFDVEAVCQHWSERHPDTANQAGGDVQGIQSFRSWTKTDAPILGPVQLS